MNSIIKFSLNNKFALWILTIIVTISGLYAGATMKQETIPDINVPILSVYAVYPGAAPEEVAESVTRPIEQRSQNLNGVITLTSTSMENVTSLVVEYDYEKDMDEAATEMREALSDLPLPDGAQEPNISRISINAFPVISLSVTDDELSLEELTEIVETEIQPSLEGLSGVATVDIAGQYVQEIALTFDQQQMAEYGLSPDTVKAIIQGSALQVPLGLFEMDGTEKTIVVDGNISTLDDLKNLAIPLLPSSAGAQPGAQPGMQPAQPGAGHMPDPAAAPNQGGANEDNGSTPNDINLSAGLPTVPLQEIAELELVGQSESISRTNGSESIGLQIVKAADANTVDVVNAVKAEAERISAEYEGMSIVTLLDQGKPIEESVSTMLNKALFGAIFAVIVILLFLRNIRTTLISVISIPLSLLIALFLLKQMDITLNMMTLGAMTVAIGRVVDDSIVVIENIYRRMSLSSEQLKGKELVIAATKEMFVPIMSSTIVTIAVFLPLVVVGGMVAELFYPFALAMVFSLLASLLVAITLVPMLGHSLFRKGLRTHKHTHEDRPGRLAGNYKRLLRWSLNHKLITMLIAVVLLFGSFALYPMIGVSFLPEEEEKYAMLTYTPAPGELITEVEEVALQAEELIQTQDQVTNFQYSVGGENPMSPGPSKSALFFIQYESDTEDFMLVKSQLLDDVQAAAAGKGEWAEMDMTGGLGGNNLSLLVYGENMEQITSAVEQIRQVVENNESFSKVETSVEKTYAQYTLLADQQKLSSLGLTAGEIAMALSPAREEPALTTVRFDGNEYEVVVTTEQTQISSIDELENKTIPSRLGMEIPLGELVSIEEGKSPNTITQKDGRMYAEITADITAKNINAASVELQDAIDELTLPPTIDVKLGGVTEQIEETFTQLGLAMLAAIAIVYLILVITFGGALAPFVILFSLPFSIIGVSAGLWVSGETLSVSAMMGALMLIGIVVTNAIVLMDRVLHKEKEGLTTRDALLEAAVTRLRPILMTALATIGALLPLAFGFESAGLISKGLGVTVIGGLTSSTLLTLIIVPIVYEFLMKFRKKRGAKAVS